MWWLYEVWLDTYFWIYNFCQLWSLLEVCRPFWFGQKRPGLVWSILTVLPGCPQSGMVSWCCLHSKPRFPMFPDISCLKLVYIATQSSGWSCTLLFSGGYFLEITLQVHLKGGTFSNSCIVDGRKFFADSSSYHLQSFARSFCSHPKWWSLDSQRLRPLS